MKRTALALAFLLSSSPVFCQDIYSNPSTVGTALPGQVPGTQTNDSAAAGEVGEYASSVIAPASEIALTTNIAVNLTSLLLTPGDWDVSGTTFFDCQSTTVYTQILTGLNTVSATLPASTGANDRSADLPVATVCASVAPSLSIGPVRVSISSTTTYYLTARGVFTEGTASIYGILRARRVR